MLACPRCRATLFPRSVDGIVLDACFGCGGVWFDKDELFSVLERSDSGSLPKPPRRRPRESSEPLSCVRCQRPMSKLAYEGTDVVLDSCSEHGLFLDGGELDRIRETTGGLGAVRDAPEALHAPTPTPEGIAERLRRVNAIHREAKEAQKTQRRSSRGRDHATSVLAFALDALDVTDLL